MSVPASVSAPPPSTRSDAARLAQGAGVVLAGRVSGRGLGYLAQLLLGRFLGPAGYGVYSVAWNLVLLLSMVASLGLEHGVIRFGADGGLPARLRGVAWRALAWAVLGGSLCAALLAAAAPWLAEGFYGLAELRGALYGFAVALVFLPVLRVAAAATRATQEMRYSVYSEELGQPIFQIALLAAAIALGWEIRGAVAATVVSILLAAVLAVGWLRRLAPPGTDAAVGVPGVGELLRFSVPTALAGLVAVVATWIDRLLVAYFLTAADAGIYQAASQGAVVFVIILSSFNAILAPMITTLYHAGRRDALDQLFKIATKWGLYLGTPIFLVYAFASETVVTALYDARYAAAARPMLILAAGQLVNLATGAVGYLLIMSGRQRVWLGLAAGALAANLVLNLLWIPRFGLQGAATATTLSVTALFGTALWMVRRRMRLWPFDRRYLKGLLAAAATAAALAGALRLEIGAPWLELVALAGVSGVVFASTMVLLGLDPEDRELLALLRGRTAS